MYEHKYYLNLNRHHSGHLQNAWNKYGADNFKFEILEYCTEEIMLDKEQEYLDKLKPAYNVSKNVTAFMLGVKRPKSFGENISRMKIGNKYFKGKSHSENAKKKIAEGKLGNNWNVGKHHTEETKDKIREKTLRQFKNGMPQETKDKLGTPVVQLSINYEFIARFNTAREAAICNSIGGKHICSVCNGKRKSAYGYYWKFQ